MLHRLSLSSKGNSGLRRQDSKRVVPLPPDTTDADTTEPSRWKTTWESSASTGSSGTIIKTASNRRINVKRIMPLPAGLVANDDGGSGFDVLPLSTRKSHPSAVLEDSTNKSPMPEKAQGWLTGPISRERVSRIPDMSPMRSPAANCAGVRTNVIRVKKPSNVIVDDDDGWGDEAPSPLKSFVRTPHLEPDGTLVFSEDELESPVKPVVVRNAKDKSLTRVAALSPARATKKGSPIRPSVVSPEASALPARRGPRLSRAPPHELTLDEPSSSRSRNSTGTSTSSTTQSQTTRDGEHDDRLDASITMAGVRASDWDDATGTAITGAHRCAPVIFIPPQPGTFTRCVMTRMSKGRYRLMPRFFLSAELEGSTQLILLARKKSMGDSSTYLVFDMRGLTMDTDVDYLTPEHPRFIGKICSVSKKAAAFTMYGRGKSNKQVARMPIDQALTELQPELGAVCFTLPTVMQKLKHQVGPRSVIALFPPPAPPPLVKPAGLDAYGQPVEPSVHDNSIGSMFVDSAKQGFKTLDTRRSLATRILEKRYEPEMSLVVSKEPVLTNGVFQLNFGGRVKIASIKNFQLVNPDDVDEVLVQFGKTSDTTFSLDFKPPYTAMQAFGVAVCQFLA